MKVTKKLVKEVVKGEVNKMKTQLDVDIEKQQSLNNSIDELCRQVEILKASQRAAKK
jgi:hypothetical protein